MPTRVEVMNTLEDMIGDETLYGSTPQQRLDWLVKAAVNAMRQWGGVAELRGILCSKWQPADGIDGYSSLPGYQAGGLPNQSPSAEHRNRKAIEAGQMLPKLLEAAECDRMSERRASATAPRHDRQAHRRRPDSPSAAGNLSRWQSVN